jgi:hypothetical protein
MNGIAVGLTCQELAELITDYLEGALTRAEDISAEVRDELLTAFRSWVADPQRPR